MLSDSLYRLAAVLKPRFPDATQRLYRLLLWCDQKIVAKRCLVARLRGYRRPTDEEVEALRNPAHNSWPRSYTPHTGEHGIVVGVDDRDWPSLLHMVSKRSSGCVLRYGVEAFMLHGQDLDEMMWIHRENLEERAAP